ncbi:MAG: prolipoprotein diacylglyceryl transferase, partial [Muribaculaceae bacterium]|nr:prolipoprotein diacylglyceryl transferase [Muribaculaceae bacterium]
PTQLYEATWYIALFTLLMWMYWKRNAEARPGLIFGVFLTLLFTGRFLIEYMKNVQVGFEEDMIARWGINMGQALSIPFILIGIFFIIRALRRPAVALEFPDRFPDEENKSR